MVNDGNQGSLASDHSLVNRGGNNKQNNTSFQPHTGQIIEGEKSFMETEGRAFSDLYRNSSEELFLKTLMESSVATPVPTMEMLGFKNFQNFRTDSVELFQSWLKNGDQNSSGIAHRSQQASRRISTELSTLSTQQQGILLQMKKSTDVLFSPFSSNGFSIDEISGDFTQNPVRTNADKGMQGNLLLTKAWFHSSQPMTRSRSSELRRRYVAMQTAQTTPNIEALLGASGNDVSKLKQEFPAPNGFSNFPVSEIPNQIPNQFGSFMSPASSPFYTVQTGNIDKVSSVVSMLKGTLERKKLGNHVEKETFEGSSNGLFHAPEHMVNFSQGQLNPVHEVPISSSEASPGTVQTIQGSIDLDLDGLVNHTNTIMSTVSRETSQSESSAAAPVVSSSFDMCDGPSNSSQTVSACETSRKQVGNGKNSENGSKPKDFRERIIDNLKDDRKIGGLVRYGSVSSNNSVDKADPTKKRRVERSRKMAEAKERSSIPTIPSDMQAVLKRCENLEKEVRSLKLNLSFMNRKDSEQTKQIEELQIQNEALSEEKERLLEEIERILGDSGRM